MRSLFRKIREANRPFCTALENEVPVTDDCSAVERLGKVVYLIDGDEENLKITTPVDLVIAEAILAEREGR